MAVSVHPYSEEHFGESLKYDPNFRGPLSKRSCTDVLCFILFLVFIVIWLTIGGFAFWKGNWDLLLVPKDSHGRRCGHDSDVLDKPYLFFVDIIQCAKPNILTFHCDTPQVCISQCPKEEFVIDLKHIDRNLLICDDDINTETESIANLGKYLNDGSCARWSLPTIPITKRCLPAIDKGIPDKIKNLNVNENTLTTAIKNIKYLAGAEEMAALVAEDLIQSWWKILIGLGGAIVICLMYIILMRWIAGFMVWLSIVGVLALLTFGVYECGMKLKTVWNDKRDTENGLFEQRYVWLAFLIILSILLLVCLLVLIFLRKRILIAIALIREGSKAVSAVTSSLFFPILPWILQLIVISYAILVGLNLTSVGNPVYTVRGISDSCRCDSYQNGSSCNPQNFSFHCGKITKSKNCHDLTCHMDGMNKPVLIDVFHAYNVIGCFWGVFFMSAFGEMVLAMTFAAWYWTFQKSKLPFFTLSASIIQTLRYHVGTLAFGSLIITICRLIRVTLEYIDHKLNKYDNPFVKGVLCCCKCFFWCLERFLKFINKNAYIMCAIHGGNFCKSAKDAFNLLMRNILRVFVLDKVTDVLFFLSKILVTMIVSIVAYTAFTNANFNVVDSKDLHYVLVPVICIGIGAFFISSVFFGVYSMAVDTLFLCFLEDCERNNGSAEKPYFMSKKLMKILGKKNKRQ